MQNLWNYISNLGTTAENRQLSDRTVVLSNQLNFVMFSSLLTGYSMSFGTLRVANLLLLNMLNLIIARFGFTLLSRLSLIYLPPIVFLLGPTLIGYVEEEGFTYYPYVLICISIIPQLLLHPKKEKFQYWFALAYYFVLVIVIDKLMVEFDETSFAQFGTAGYPIVERINTFYAFYKIPQIGLFLFTNASIFYLRMLNFRFEEELTNRNKELDLQNVELKAQKEEIERHKDELVNKEISTWQKLVSIISHEIVNSAIPITNLAGMTAQMLEDESGTVLKPAKIGEETTEDIHHSLKIIETRTQGLINFVKATKSLTQIPKPNMRRILLKELFERITMLYQAKFKETGVQFEKQVIPPDLYIEADLELIEQVIINLIQNSLEAMQETSVPKLSITALINESGQIQISVSDNGVGISDDVLERLFLPFYSTKANNSGIGLSLSQQIMMLHHGRLEVVPGQKEGAILVMIF
jgi:signal transduction histidine kinase